MTTSTYTGQINQIATALAAAADNPEEVRRLAVRLGDIAAALQAQQGELERTIADLRRSLRG